MAKLPKRIKSAAPQLLTIVNAKGKQQKNLIEKATKEIISCLVQCAKNVLLGNVSMSKAHISKLHPHKEDLENLVKKKTSTKRKKKILQKGGFLSLLLRPLLPLLGSALGGIIGGGRRR